MCYSYLWLYNKQGPGLVTWQNQLCYSPIGQQCCLCSAGRPFCSCSWDHSCRCRCACAWLGRGWVVSGDLTHVFRRWCWLLDRPLFPRNLYSRRKSPSSSLEPHSFTRPEWKLVEVNEGHPNENRGYFFGVSYNRGVRHHRCVSQTLRGL